MCCGVRNWLYHSHNRPESTGIRRKQTFSLQDFVESWIPASSAPSYWSPDEGLVPCSSPANILDCSHRLCQSTSLCEGLWLGVVRSPLRPGYHHSWYNFSKVLQEENKRHFCVQINAHKDFMMSTSTSEIHSSMWGHAGSFIVQKHMTGQPFPALH